MKQKVWDALIIGAGHNGLVTAAYLARAGLNVLVLERRDVLGGACVTEEIFPGFKVSTAAYLCGLLPERIIRDLDLPRRGYHVFPKDPALFTPFQDDTCLTVWQSASRTSQEIAKFSSKDAGVYSAYLDFVERLARVLQRVMLQRPPNLADVRFSDLLSWARLGWLLAGTGEEERVGVARVFTQSAEAFLDPWFEAEQLKVTLAADGVIGTNAGPRSPGTAYVLLHHVMGEVNGRRGLWGFVRGGMGAVSTAIAAAAREAGATIREQAEVELILLQDGCASGVVLNTGEVIRARSVVSNADPKRTFLKLLDPDQLDPQFRGQIESIRMRGCAMKMNLALDGLPSFRAMPGSTLMPHHRTTIHICPDLDYLERAWDDAKYGQPSRNPFLQITIPTTYDNSLAPAGKHLMGVFLQYTPYEVKEGSWAQMKEAYADRVMDLIEEYAPGFKNLVLDRQVLSPVDLESTFGLTCGDIFHGEMSPDQLFSLRPLPGWSRYRTPIGSLYLCGAGTHPGGGVMGACGYNAARQFLGDWRWGRI